MKQHTTLLTIGLGCVLLIVSGCAAYRDAANSMGCGLGYLSGGVSGNFAPNLLGCAIGVTAEYTLGAIERKVRGTRDDYDLITTEPVVVHWDETYSPLPTTDKPPTPPDNAVLPHADSSLPAKLENSLLTASESHNMAAPEARNSTPLPDSQLPTDQAPVSPAPATPAAP